VYYNNTTSDAHLLECIVNWPEPTDEGARNKQDKKENWNSERRSRLIRNWMLGWCYEVCQRTNDIQQQQCNVCCSIWSTVHAHIHTNCNHKCCCVSQLQCQPTSLDVLSHSKTTTYLQYSQLLCCQISKHTGKSDRTTSAVCHHARTMIKASMFHWMTAYYHYQTIGVYISSISNSEIASL